MRLRVVWAVTGAVLLAAGGVACGGDSNGASAKPATFEEVQEIVDRRCITCHSLKPTFENYTEAAASLRLDQPENIKLLYMEIERRVVTNKDMPLQNATGMTPAERERIASWIATLK